MKAWKLMGRMMAYRPWLYLADAVLWIGIHSSFLLPGILAKLFFDSLEGKAFLGLGSGAVLALIASFAAARICLIYSGAVVDILHRFVMSSLLRYNAFDALTRLPGAAPLSCTCSEALDYVKEDAQQVEDAISWSFDVMGSAFFTVAAIFLLLRIDPYVTLLAFVPLVVVVVVAQTAENKVGRYREASRRASEAATGAMTEAFAAVQAIKVAGAEEGAMAHIAQLCERRRRAALKDGVFGQLLDSIFHNTVGVGTGLILLVVAARIGKAGFSLGDFSLFVFCLEFVSDYTCFWGSFLAQYQRARVSFDRLKEMTADGSGEGLVAAPDPGFRRPWRSWAAEADGRGLGLASRGGAAARARPPSGPPWIAARKRYADRPADRFQELRVEDLSSLHAGGRGLREASLEVRRGELVVVTGRIGSGKTTLLRAVQGLLPSKGRITWNGFPVRDPAAFFAPPRSAYTPQAPVLFSDSLLENVLLGMEEGDGEVERALRAAALEEDVTALPEGLGTKIGPRGVKLSGGQVQRAAAARMFLRDSALYFIDDMSSALDAETEELLWRRFLEGGRRSCLAVSHRKGTLKLADRVIVLKEGLVDASGKLDEVLRDSEEMRLLWGSS